jgi:hypothetical protein
MSIPASTNTHLPVRTGMPNNVASKGVDEFGLRADDHDSLLRTDLGGKVMAASIRHLRSWFPGRPSRRLATYPGEATLLG